MSHALRAAGRRRHIASLALIAAMLLGPSGNVLTAQTSSPKKTPAQLAQDSVKAAAAKKAAADKAAAGKVTAGKPAAGKATADKAAAAKATAAKAAATKAAATKAAADKAAAAKTTTAPASRPSAAPARTGTATRTTPRAAGSAAATSAGGIPKRAEAYSQVGIYAGGATAGLGFGTGPSGGLVWRHKSARFPLALRADVSVSRFAQQPLTTLGDIAGDASLLHAGGAIGLEWVGRHNRAIRPYATVSGGVYRFQGSGPAGINGTVADGVFAATTDVALLAGAGVRLGNRMFLEARIVTVGDFQSIPVVIGVHF